MEIASALIFYWISNMVPVINFVQSARSTFKIQMYFGYMDGLHWIDVYWPVQEVQDFQQKNVGGVH